MGEQILGLVMTSIHQYRKCNHIRQWVENLVIVYISNKNLAAAGEEFYMWVLVARKMKEIANQLFVALVSGLGD